MNAFLKGMTAMVLLGVLLMTTFWVVTTGLSGEASGVIASYENLQSPAAIPAPAPHRETVLNAHNAGHETLAHNGQAAPIPAPAHPK